MTWTDSGPPFFMSSEGIESKPGDFPQLNFFIANSISERSGGGSFSKLCSDGRSGAVVGGQLSLNSSSPYSCYLLRISSLLKRIVPSLVLIAFCFGSKVFLFKSLILLNMAFELCNLSNSSILLHSVSSHVFLSALICFLISLLSDLNFDTSPLHFASRFS